MNGCIRLAGYMLWCLPDRGPLLVPTGGLPTTLRRDRVFSVPLSKRPSVSLLVTFHSQNKHSVTGTSLVHAPSSSKSSGLLRGSALPLALSSREVLARCSASSWVGKLNSWRKFKELLLGLSATPWIHLCCTKVDRNLLSPVPSLKCFFTGSAEGTEVWESFS